MLLSPFATKPLGVTDREWRGDLIPTALNGHFQLYGLAPESEIPALFLEPKRKLGAAIKVSAKLAQAAPINVRLQPCGAAKARLIKPDGKPAAHCVPHYMAVLLLVPGPSRTSHAPADQDRPSSIGDFLTRIDIINYAKDPVSNANGQILFPALIPGATYRLQDRTAARGTNGAPTRKEFTVKPGETLDLGDILIQNPTEPTH